MRRLLPLLALAVTLLVPAAAPAATTIDEFKLSEQAAGELRARWADKILAKHSLGTWAPMRMELDDEDLALMGLPSERVLMASRYDRPTKVYRDGRKEEVAAAGPPVASFAGTGFFGIRPGAWLLIFSDGGISLCSMAHVYGSPGSYEISTAGHCGRNGDTATVIGAVGDHEEAGTQVPVLIDFGTFSRGTGDGGIGRDWALISIKPEWQSLVTPTMAFWGGPIGMYTPTGEVVSANLQSGTISTNPNPTLVQQVVHYGHGLGLGPGGTPRSGTAITWRPDYFTFFGAITPGDSGSGSNTLTGDTVGANREAAGINTHIYVDSSLRQGVGTMAGTRATLVPATLANGQILPYPAPTPVPLP
jgi:hypothetical protein